MTPPSSVTRYPLGPRPDHREKDLRPVLPGFFRFANYSLMVSDALLKETEAGLVPEGDGWFVVNARDVALVAERRVRPVGSVRG